jgi:heme-degrading monooxygenase HmoA
VEEEFCELRLFRVLGNCAILASFTTIGATALVGSAGKGGKAVHARVSILEGPPDKIDEGLLYFREEVEPAWETDPGFKGAIALNDRQSGKTLAITFWEREEDMRAMEKEANRVRSKVAETTGQEIAGVEQYEVGLFEVEG